MRDINIGDQVVRVRATALALLYYKQEFKADLLGDLTRLTKMMKLNEKGEQEIDFDNLDFLPILQIIWAMAKADKFGNDFPPFQTWLGSIENINFGDPAFMSGAMEEAVDGFFRSGVKGAVEKSRR